MSRSLILALTMLVCVTAVLGAQGADQLFESGRAAFADELWPTAASKFNRFLNRFPDDSRADTSSYLQGIALLNAGKLNDAALILSTFPQVYPDSVWMERVAYWEGLAHYKLGDFQAAARAFRRQAAIGNQQVYRQRTLMYLGSSLQKVSDWKGAEAVYEALLDFPLDDATRGAALSRLGHVRLVLGSLEGALEAFSRLDLDYTVTEAARESRFWIAEVERRLGRDEAALSSYRSFIETNGNSSYRPEALLEAARLAYRLGSYTEALDFLNIRKNELFSAGDDQNVVVLRIRADSNLRTGNVAAARKAYSAILQQTDDPHEAQVASFGIAQTWIGTSGMNKALPELERAARGPDGRIAADALYSAARLLLLDKDPRSINYLWNFINRYLDDERRETALQNLVRIQRDTGRESDARESLDFLIDEYPESDNLDAYLFLRAELAMNRNAASSALSDYGRIVNLPTGEYTADAYSRIGYIYAQRGEHSRASEYYVKASSAAGGLSGGEKGRRAMYSTGLAYLNADDSEKAIEVLRPLISDLSAPWGFQAAYYLGEAYYDSGNYGQARNAYARAAEYGSGSWIFEASYAIGWTWFRESRWDRAAVAFENASRHAVNDEQRARAFYRVGLSRTSAGQWQDALSYYRRALSYRQGQWREEALYQSAWSLLKLGRIDEGLKEAAVLSREFPESSLAADIPFRMGEDAMSKGKYSQALEWYDRCVEDFPQSGKALQASLRAALAARKNGDPAGAAVRYQEWISAHTNDPSAIAAARSWAESLVAAGNPQLADRARESALSIAGGVTALSAPVILGWARLAGNPAKAAGYLEDISRKRNIASTDRAEALLLRADRYRMDGEGERSRQIYEVLIRDVRGRIGAEAQEGLARSLADEGRIAESAEAFLSIPYLFPDEKELGNRALREAEKLYRQSGREDEADKIRRRLSGS